MSNDKKVPVVVGLVTLIDPREEFYTNFQETKGMDLREQYQFNHSSALEMLVGETIIDLGVVEQQEDVYGTVDRMKEVGVELVLLNLPGWTPPGWGGIIYSMTGLPLLIFAPFALSGPLAMRGELAALGAECEVSFGDEELVKSFIDRIRARKLLTSLRSVRAGRIGGFSMGMHYADPGSADILRDFGIEIIPVDGTLVLHEAARLEGSRVNNFIAALQKNTSDYPEKIKPVLEKQVRYYLALKDLAERECFDFLSVQCQPEFSDIHGALCFAVSFLPAPADSEGEKKIIPVSCEGDFYAVLAGFLLHRLSGVSPFFGDIIMPFFDDNILAVQNCGGASTWYAAHSANQLENLNRIRIVNNIQGKCGSYGIDYLSPALAEATVLAMGPNKCGYWMAAETVELVERDELKPLLMDWPTLFIKADDARDLLNRIYTQHIALVPGNYAKVLGMCIDQLKWGELSG